MKKLLKIIIIAMSISSIAFAEINSSETINALSLSGDYQCKISGSNYVAHSRVRYILDPNNSDPAKGYGVYSFKGGFQSDSKDYVYIGQAIAHDGTMSQH